MLLKTSDNNKNIAQLEEVRQYQEEAVIDQKCPLSCTFMSSIKSAFEKMELLPTV